jgi:hypothetical protein
MYSKYDLNILESYAEHPAVLIFISGAVGALGIARYRKKRRLAR